MTFTYDASQLQTSMLMRMRMELDDTESGRGVKPNGGNLQDEELEAIIAEAGGDFYTAMAKTCRLLATQWARYADVSAGKTSERASQVSIRYQQRAAEYEAQAATGGASAFSGGVAGSVYAGIVNDWETDDVVNGEQTMTYGGEYGG